MNSYEAKIEARRERLLALADKMQAASDAAYRRARDMASVIPMGQPILVGHYSEKRDRNYRARIWRTQGRCVELQKKAEYYRGLAAGVGNGGISSDDPEAVVKLREELAKLENLQRMMKLANAAIRREKKNGEPAQLSAIMKVLGCDESRARKLLAPDFCGRIGFADYQLKNNGANIRRIEARIASLARRPTELVERELEGGIRWREDPDENRLMLIFPGKPPASTREVLKKNGFRWSPTNGAWQRQLNNGARQSAEWVVRQILGKPTASASPEVAAMIDPGGALRDAGLLKVEGS